MLYMGVQCESCITGGGVAYSPAVCRPNADEIKLSVCFFSTSYAMMAETMGHEIGHNLGWAFVKRKFSQFSHIFLLTREKLAHKKRVKKLSSFRKLQFLNDEICSLAAYNLVKK